MNNNVVNLQTNKRYPPIVKSKELDSQQQPSNDMIWEVCFYVKQGEKCFHCTEDEIDHPEYGKCKSVKSCQIWAKAACQAVFAMQQREAINAKRGN
jgi:hypothetical protein